MSAGALGSLARGFFVRYRAARNKCNNEKYQIKNYFKKRCWGRRRVFSSINLVSGKAQSEDESNLRSWYQGLGFAVGLGYNY